MKRGVDVHHRRWPEPGRAWRLMLAGVALLAAGGCQSPRVQEDVSPPCSPEASAAGWGTPHVFRTADRSRIPFDAFMEAIAEGRAVVIGELHPRYDHHLTQVEIICRLERRKADVAVGLEFVQSPYQQSLDEYLAGELDLEAWLERSQYYRRWAYDFRLYAPVLEFAKATGLPLIALNVPAELTGKASHEGLEALSDEEKGLLPEAIEPADQRYRERLRAIFDLHDDETKGGFEDFLNVQLLWDSGMAARAAKYLEAHPGATLVVLAGNGHVAYRNAIPDRLQRRIGGRVIAVSQDVVVDAADDVDAEYRLLSKEIELPAAGKLGLYLTETDEGMRVRSFTEGSAAAEAGLREGDRIARIDGRRIESFTDVKTALWQRRAGDRVALGVVREGEPLSFELSLR